MKKIYKNWRFPLTGDQWSSGSELIVKKTDGQVFYVNRIPTTVREFHLSKRFRDK